MAKKKIDYLYVSIPKAVMEKVDYIIEEFGLYRSRAEFFIDAGRERYRKIIKTLYRQKKLSRKKPKGLENSIKS